VPLPPRGTQSLTGAWCRRTRRHAARPKHLLSGPPRVQVKNIPVEDLQTIDALWVAASGGKFGFSVQRQIWNACDGKWSKFFVAIDWLKGENLNYRVWPTDFVYDVDAATKGHLPLTNALRGTQLFEAILTHPAFAAQKDPRMAWSD
jgi:GUN4-like